MAGRLEGKVAFITGGGGGIGRETAVLFGREGATVAVADLNEANLAETVRLVKETGSLALSFTLDVTNSAQLKAAVDETAERYGRFDVIFNNAGIGHTYGNVLQHSEEEWDRVMDVNLKAVFLGMKHGGAAMLKFGNGGSIISTASVGGVVGYAGYAAYGASKAGVIHLTKTAALELARHNIRVNAIAPTFTETNLVDALIGGLQDKERGKQKLANVIPLGRLGKPLEIAQGALYLASDESSFMTGATLVLDGGLTIQ